jgi:putative oxidoreductase
MKALARRFPQNRWLIVGLRYVIGFVFVYAAVGKIAEPDTFARAILNYKLVPLFSVNMLALLLPWIELLAGLGMIVGVHLRGNALLIGGLLSVFIIAVGIALARGLDISCGCFGTTSASKVGWSHIGENVALLVGVAIVYFSPSSIQSKDTETRA